MERKVISCVGWGIKPSGVTTMQIEAYAWNGTTRGKFFMTANVLRRVDGTHIQCADGREYKLVGDLDYVRGEKLGIPTRILDSFKGGVPEDWRQVIDGWLDDSAPSVGEVSTPRRMDADTNRGVKVSSKKAPTKGQKESVRITAIRTANADTRHTTKITGGPDCTESRRAQPSRRVKSNTDTVASRSRPKSSEAARPKRARLLRNVNKQEKRITPPDNKEGTGHLGQKSSEAAKPKLARPLRNANEQQEKKTAPPEKEAGTGCSGQKSSEACMPKRARLLRNANKQQEKIAPPDKEAGTGSPGQKASEAARPKRKSSDAARPKQRRLRQNDNKQQEKNMALPIAITARKGTLKRRIQVRKAKEAIAAAAAPSDDIFQSSSISTKGKAIPSMLLLAGSDEEQEDAIWKANHTPSLRSFFDGGSCNTTFSSILRMTPSPDLFASDQVLHRLEKAMKPGGKRGYRPTSTPKAVTWQKVASGKKLLKELHLLEDNLQDIQEREDRLPQSDEELDYFTSDSST
ncbi:unnamed protein product [Ixodes hexagonus]